MIYLIIIVTIFILGFVASNQRSEHEYKATFGSPSDHLSFWNRGFAIGPKSFTQAVSKTNFLLTGPTGSGKSSIVTIPCAASLSRGRASIIFNDVSGELWNYTSEYLAMKGYKILRLDFSNSQYSETFNPLAQCKSIADIQKLCQIVIQNTTGESKSDPFWENSSIMLLSLFGRYLVFHTEPKFRTLQNLQRLIEKFAIDVNGEVMDKLFVQTKDENLLSTYKATLIMGDRTLQSVIATARTALHLFSDPEVSKTTSSNSINLNILRNNEQPVAIYCANPLKDLRYFKPLSTLFFQSVFNYVLSRIPRKNERPIFFVLDEFASMKFPDIAVTISNIRKYNAGMLLCVQDDMSLGAQYGHDQAHQIKTNCGIQCHLKGAPLHTCKELSQILGKYTYVDDKGITRTRELMTPDEIRIADAAIVLVNNQPPLKLDSPTPYYQSIWLWKLANAKPFCLSKKNTSEPPLLEFN